MKPSVGRIVHFYHMAKDAPSGTTAPCAAIITHVFDEPDDAVNLVVFQNGAVCFENIVSTKDYNDRRYWEWPPRDAAPVPAVIDPKALPAPAMPEAVILSGYVPAIVNDNPDPLRRYDHVEMSRAESIIKSAMLTVEAIGNHPWITDAIVLLSKALEKVSDYIDRIPAEAPQPAPRYEHAGGVADENVQTVDDTGEDIDPSLRA